MRLNHEEFGSGPLLVLVHGLFGSGTNLRGIARLLADKYRVVSVDLPNHGRSPHSDSMTYADMSQSLQETVRQFGETSVNWVGHSMGGKAVMALALEQPGLVNRLVIVDIAPVRYSHDQWALINAMEGLDLRNLRSRAEADRLLAGDIPDTPTRLFLLQNLVPHDGGYRWRLNLPAISRHHDDIMGFPVHPGVSCDAPVMVLRGERSDYVTEAYHDAFRRFFPATQFETISGAGHWVHADKPVEVCEAIIRFLGARE